MTPLALFDEKKYVNDHHREFWKARELGKILGYSEYRHFKPVIEKAKEACEGSGYAISDHFEHYLDMVNIGSGTQRSIEDIKLSRYACYLVVQNADPSKDIVAKGQTYFAIQTRKQEVQDDKKALSADEKRIYLREEMKIHNKKLAGTAKQAGVTNFADFTDAGYEGLYGGLRQADIHKKKGLQKDEKILDHMNSEELAANLFRATQTESKIKRESIKGQVKATRAHFEVGQKVRATIKEIGGTMPEELPAVEDIQKIKKRLKAPPRKVLK